VPQIERAYIKTGRVKYVVRDFPLEAIHADAFKAAEAAHCAGDGGAFWPMLQRLFTHQSELTRAELPGHAQAVGVDAAAFRQCLESGKYAVRVHRDIADGIRAGVNSTPSFFIGVPAPDQRVRVVRLLRGAQPFAAFKEIIDSLLTRSPS
jgi:protein-disulfide isomerase